MNSILKKLTLADFALPEDFQIKPLTYSGIQGKAEVMGCYIIVFRTSNKPNETTAISLDDMQEDSFVKAVGNDILKRLELYVSFGDGIAAIRNIYGEPFAANETSEDTTHYYYMVNNGQIFLDFGVSKLNGLYSLEIVGNAEVIKKRKERLNAYHTV